MNDGRQKVDEQRLTEVVDHSDVGIGPCYYVNDERVARDTYDKVAALESEVERLRAIDKAARRIVYRRDLGKSPYMVDTGWVLDLKRAVEGAS